MSEVPKRVDEYLDEIDYDFVGYMPTAEALMFVNFIKEVNDGSEENETPLVHLVMMDKVFNKKRRCAVLVSRGIGKTTLFAEYLILFIAAFGYFPGFGKLNLMLYVTDSIENGVKNLRRNVEFRYANSDFLQKLIPNKKIQVGQNGASYVDIDDFEEASSKQIREFGGHKFTDIRLEFENNKGHKTVVKGYGAKALSLDSKLYMENGTTTIGQCSVGDQIFGADGKLCTITEKSEVFHKPMYQLELMDGRTIKVSEDHINSVIVKENPHNTVKYVKKDLLTKELLELPLYLERNRGTYISKENLLFIENCKPLNYEDKKLPFNPYVLGLLLGDGSMKKDGSVKLHAHKDDMDKYMLWLEKYELGSVYVDKRNPNVVSTTIKGVSGIIRGLGVNIHGDHKFVPEDYKYAGYEQRFALLAGLMDTDGTISKTGRMSFCSNSERLARDVIDLVRSLGGSASIRQDGRAFKVEIKININIFMLERKRARFNPGRVTHTRVGIKSITAIEDEPSQCIAVNNEEHQFITDNYVRTHNTGVRGSKEMGQRPTLAVFDDLFSDEDANSPTIIANVENTIYKAVSKALSPTKQKMVWLGTPFNQSDPLYKAVESGAWEVACYPVCEHFDSTTTREEFKGAWPDRFDYDYVKAEFDEAMKLGRPSDFYQELMLRISSEEDRLVPDSDIIWYSRDNMMTHRRSFNYYLTSDAGTSESKTADFSVLLMWGINNNGDRLLVDAWFGKAKLNETIDELFRMVRRWNKYSFFGAGIEVSGQQTAILTLIQNRMIDENTYFNLFSHGNNNQPGIRPSTNKYQRFQNIQPLFAAKKIWLPEEMKQEPFMVEYLNEIRGVSRTNTGKKIGTARHDDLLDATAMMSMIEMVEPSIEAPVVDRHEDGVFYTDYVDPNEPVNTSYDI